MLPWLRSIDPGDSATLLVFSKDPNIVDYFYVKKENGGIDVKVVRPPYLATAGLIACGLGGSVAMHGQIGFVRGWV